MRTSTKLIGLALVALMLASCSALIVTPKEKTAEAVEVTVPVPEPTVEAKPVREFWPLSEYEDYRIPNVVGMTVPEAEDVFEEWDAYVKTEDASEDERRIWASGNWTVVSQYPAPGTQYGEGSRIDLLALKHEEAAPSVAKFQAADQHTGERVFSGIITGYDGDQTLLVDNAEIKLDLITPITHSCGLEIPGSNADHPSQLSELLPVGTEVLAVRSEDNRKHGFLHIRTPGMGWPLAPLSSVNEGLVRSGWWMPWGPDFEGGFVANKSDGASFVSYASGKFLTPVQEVYAPLIAGAANTAVSASTAHMGECRAVAERNANLWVEHLAEREREMQEWQAEYQRRLASGYYSCRDGDGDGVCYER